MMPATDNVPTIADNEKDTFRHDVRAQIININCLAKLVEEAVDGLDSTTASGQKQEDSSGTHDAVDAIRNDVLPFITMIVDASNKLDLIIKKDSDKVRAS